MDSTRANEIMNSKGVINVKYNGTPVWIDSTKGDIADVTIIGQEKHMSVPIKSLVED